MASVNGTLKYLGVLVCKLAVWSVLSCVAFPVSPYIMKTCLDSACILNLGHNLSLVKSHQAFNVDGKMHSRTETHSHSGVAEARWAQHLRRLSPSKQVSTSDVHS